MVKHTYTVLRARKICLKLVHPAKRARAQELFIDSQPTYAFNNPLTSEQITLWGISLDEQKSYLDDRFADIVSHGLPPAHT